MKSKGKDKKANGFLCILCGLPGSWSSSKTFVTAKGGTEACKDGTGSKEEIIDALIKLSDNVLKMASSSSSEVRQSTIKQYQPAENHSGSVRKVYGRKKEREIGGVQEESVNKLKLESVIEFCKEDEIKWFVCKQCVIQMKETTAARLEMVYLEQQVVTMQCLLLQKLRSLQQQTTGFYERMKLLEEIVTNAGMSMLEPCSTGSREGGQRVQDECLMRMEWVLKFRRQIVEVSQQVNLYNEEIKNKVGQGCQLQNSKRTATGALLPPPSSPPPTKTLDDNADNGKDKVSGRFDEGTKLEEDSDGNYAPDNMMECASDFEQDAEPETCQGSQKKGEISTPRRITSRPSRKVTKVKKRRFNKPEDYSDSVSEEGSDDANSDYDYNPKTEMNVRKILKSTTIAPSRIPREAFFSTIEIHIEGMSDFKRGVIRRATKKQFLSFGADASRKRTPFDKYMLALEYDMERKCIRLKQIDILIQDKLDNSQLLENGLMCSVCAFTVHSKGNNNSIMETTMYDHVISKHLEAYKCDKCQVRFDTHLDYRQHRQDCQNSNVICDICGRPLKSKRVLYEHRWLHFSEEEKQERRKRPPRAKTPSEERQLFSCTICSKGFRCKQTLKRHMEIHQDPEDRRRFICPHCGKQFLKGGWSSHKIYSDCAVALGNGGNVRALPAECRFCGAKKKNAHSLRQHIVRFHTEKGQEKSFVCQQCGKAFRHLSFLLAHENTHAGIKPFQCPRCARCFSVKKNMQRHQKTCLADGSSIVENS